jgi:hypothetical protein
MTDLIRLTQLRRRRDERRRARRRVLEQMDMAAFEAARAAIGRAVLRAEL